MGLAQTGTGKTAAFLLPIMNYISEKRPVHTHTLILVPTRELAIQIDQQIQGLAYTLNITSLAVYGGGDGHGWEQEKAALSKGTDIIVATPTYRAIRNAFPKIGITLLTSPGRKGLPGAREIIQPLNLVDEIIIFYPDELSTAKKLFTFIKNLR